MKNEHSQKDTERPSLLLRDANPRRRSGRRKLRARSSRTTRSNPQPYVWYALAGGTALVVGGLAWWTLRDRPATSTIPKQPILPPGTKPKPTPQPIRHGSYVGDPKGPYAWPRADLFPSADAFGDVLERLGYDVGDWQAPSWSPLSGTVQAAVTDFQRDWNLYRAHINDPWAPALAPDGRLGDNTVTALAGVAEAMQLGLDWPNTIYQLKSGEIS